MSPVAENTIPPEPKHLRRTCWLIFILTILVYLIPNPFGEGHFLLTKSRAESWNDQARIATVESMVERHTLAIEHSKWGWMTGDKVLLRDHWYSTKPPLLSAAGAVSYMIGRWAVKAITGHELTYRHNEDVIYPFVTLTTSVLAFALLLVYFYRSLFLVRIPSGARWWIFWALAAGSLYPAYSTVINNHSVAGAGVFIAFYYVIRHRLGGRVKWWEFVWAGLSMGFAGMNDFTGALPFLPLFFVLIALYDFPLAQFRFTGMSQRGYIAAGMATILAVVSFALLRIGPRGTAIILFTPLLFGIVIGAALAVRKRPASILYLAGVLVPVIAHLYLNSRITGNWLPTYIQSDVYIAVPPGFFGEVISPEEAGALYWARWKYVGTALFGIRGIFLYTPTLLFGLVSAFAIAFRRGHRLRLDAASLIIAVLAGWGYTLFFASPNFGGTSYGYRYALAASPILLFFCYRVFTEWKGPALTTIFRNVVAWGTLVALIAIPFPWGIFGQLPSTQFSIVENLSYIALSILVLV
jgi:hypothetical protein